QAPRRGKQRIDLDLRDGALLDYQLAEAHQQLLQLRRIHFRIAVVAGKRGVDLRLLHHPARERGVQRREGQRTVLEHLDEQPAGSEEQHGAELRIDAAADDQLVSAFAEHRLHGDAFEVGGPAELGEAAPYGLERALYLPRAAQIELNATHFALVRDGPRMQLDRDRVSERLRRAHGLLGGRRGPRLHRRTAVSGEAALRLQFGEERAPIRAGRAQDLCRLLVPEGGFLRERWRLVEGSQVV